MDLKQSEEEKSRVQGELAVHYNAILSLLGEDPKREGLLKTPFRVAKAMQFLTKGYSEDPETVLRSAMFQEEDYKQMVIVKDIDFFSLCEHHMLPFFGKAHVAYIPNGEVVGLSKIARTVEVFARRLQLQEQLTAQIADAFMDNLHPQGVMVMIEAEHLCMTMRGIKKPGAQTVTTVTRGVFDNNKELQDTFYQMVRL